MKSLFDISWKVDEPTYRKDKSYSQSTIGKFDREGFDALPTLFDHVDTPQLRFGSLVDCIVTGTKEEFNSRYFIVDFPKTTESLENIARELFKRYNKVYKSFNEIPDEDLNKTGIECDYYANPRYDDKRLKLIKTNCAQIYDLMFLAKGKECGGIEIKIVHIAPFLRLPAGHCIPPYVPDRYYIYSTVYGDLCQRVLCPFVRTCFGSVTAQTCLRSQRAYGLSNSASHLRTASSIVMPVNDCAPR